MKQLLFKKWIISEMADFGFDQDQRNKPQGGTEEMKGDNLFKSIDSNKIITELTSLPSLGPNNAIKRWNNVVEWGVGPGAIQVGITPLGSMRIIIRRMTKDLYGENTWICEKVVPLGDNAAEDKEILIAHDVHDIVNEVSKNMVYGPSEHYEDIERLSWKLWTAAKRDHPSYCMFPVTFRKQNENYYKLVFEFRGGGVQKSGQSRSEQFNIDMIWEKGKGLIRFLGYDIESSIRKHSWEIAPSEFNEYFSPQQKTEDIIESIIKTFLQY